MRAITLNLDKPTGISLEEVSLPDLKPHEVKVQLKAAALNHRDEWCRQGRYPNISNGVVLGSDGAGIVVEVGSDVESSWLGKEVIINAATFWGEDQKVQSKDFQILGMPSNGTLAEYVHVEASRLCEKPSHLSFEEAASLPLAGLTAYRACFYHGQLQPGMTVLVTGIGGGVAQFAAQFAVTAGAEVYVSSSDKAKINRAKDFGVKEGFDYKNESWIEDALSQTGGMDLIVDSAMGDTLPDLIKLLKPGGKLVFYGATLGNPPMLDARRIFWNQLTLQGTTMGSDQDFKDMVTFVNEEKITPLVDSVRPLEKSLEAFELMKAGKQTGKLVVKID
ncbi:zinc-binding dehydrogenase [Echinicola sp. CAU 1574]|uniref:Zinc-binding dehydrogenase n=1 Tax=Echinicola arenosa TaxID=2774144 RepID=A0ABR9ANU8_9BACT|nr:zinc-binding dehydrogenase [Echinicola arenosa]MBD8490456.1 zinc-binding dehydrogenase [Echinicola arenosa]